MDGWILFDDGGGALGPLTDLRPAFELRTGALTSAERLTEQLGRHPDALFVPEPLAELTRTRHTEPVNQLPDAGDPLLLLNGRWTCIDAQLPEQRNTACCAGDGTVLAAMLDRAVAESWLSGTGSLPASVEMHRVETESLLEKPWQLLDQARANLWRDLETVAKRLSPMDREPAPRVTIVGRHPVLVGEGATVHPHVVFDTSAGPVAVDDGAEVRSMSVLVGPGYVGPGSAIVNHAHIRGRCIVGPQCKVGGEVNASVFQGWANKAHAGYLGDSFVGAWANLGASTVTSNLKNTYGPVRMRIEPDAEPEDTGMTHLGSIIGDHVRTAIGTRLMTGSCLHTGAMLAASGFPPKCVERFAFLTDAGADRYALDKFLEVAEHVMSRRGFALNPPLTDRLTALHAGR